MPFPPRLADPAPTPAPTPALVTGPIRVFR